MNGDIRQLTTEEIVERYADMVYRIAVNETGSRTDAEDVFQEVFLRLVKYRDRISGEEHLKAWLIRVTLNCARKHTGSSWNKKVVYFNEPEDENTPDESAESDYTRIENADSPLTEAVARLPEIYRIVIYLFYYEELSIVRIAEILKEKETTIKSRLHRAREMLKIDLEGEEL
ncbi:MAG: RNA polymerase sigma factor [Lachnospiraceae bacterium]